ncbi:hypothetical protein CDAR_461011 [Caerostris darwini]|uniref:N-acetyltransferase domain-containing protein n=1 Tax=Caerostris darwini TaxID=1538125 RepID=A0AAV4W1S1_9ARAC|nr:hypothetical protein CDAR_461011 [Caerostris darwini]
MARVAIFAKDFVCNTAPVVMRKSKLGHRNMSGSLIQTVKEEEETYQVQALRPKNLPNIRFRVRPANADDLPILVKIRQDMGIHDVPTSLLSWMKLDPDGIKIAETETGDVVGSCSSVFNGDDDDGIYFGGIYCVEPKFQGTGIGQNLFKSCVEHYGTGNCGLNAVPGMYEVYRDRAGFPVEEPDWVCVKNQTSTDVSQNVLSNIVPPGVDIQPYQDSFLPAMVAYDQALIGFKRSLQLLYSCEEVDNKTLVAFKDGVCVGFGTIKESCLRAGRIGPLYADEPVIAEVILGRLLDSFPERKGFAMMTISNNMHANSFLRKLGCPAKEECRRLYSSKRLMVDTSKIYAHFDINFSPF